MAETEVIYGTVDRIIYQNQENGFTVFVVNVKSNAITVKGFMPTVIAG